MQTWLLTLGSVAAVSLIALIGLTTLLFNQARVRRAASWLIAFAVGALLGDAFIHLIPEAFADQDTLVSSLLILAGMLAFFVAEKLLHYQETALTIRPVAALNLIGDAIHNVLDGMLIAASYLVDPTLGVSTTLAVLAHETPQELGDFGTLIHGGLQVRRAVLLNLAAAGAALAGAVAVLLIGTVASAAVTAILVPAAAGGFVYIAAADLIPELHRDRSASGLVVQVALIACGIGVMALLTLTE